MIGLSDSDPDPRIVLVTITEQDIQTLGSWPLSGDVLAQVLESVARFGPRAIGVDICRDIQVPPASKRLDGLLRNNGPHPDRERLHYVVWAIDSLLRKSVKFR